jgi:hypothetical protein
MPLFQELDRAATSAALFLCGSGALIGLRRQYDIAVGI